MKRDGSEGGSGEPVDSIAVILVENDSDTQLQFAELHYFAISRSAKAEYCDTFPNENGRTCRNVGAITAWTKKRENDDVFQTYRREYKKRFARIRSGALLPEEFYRWSEQARQKKDELEAGEIDADAFLA